MASKSDISRPLPVVNPAKVRSTPFPVVTVLAPISKASVVVAPEEIVVVPVCEAPPIATVPVVNAVPTVRLPVVMASPRATAPVVVEAARANAEPAAPFIVSAPLSVIAFTATVSAASADPTPIVITKATTRKPKPKPLSIFFIILFFDSYAETNNNFAF